MKRGSENDFDFLNLQQNRHVVRKLRFLKKWEKCQLNDSTVNQIEKYAENTIYKIQYIKEIFAHGQVI